MNSSILNIGYYHCMYVRFQIGRYVCNFDLCCDFSSNLSASSVKVFTKSLLAPHIPGYTTDSYRLNKNVNYFLKCFFHSLWSVFYWLAWHSHTNNENIHANYYLGLQVTNFNDLDWTSVFKYVSIKFGWTKVCIQV